MFKTLVSANIKQHKGSLAGVLILTLLAAASIGTVLTVWTNSGTYIRSETKRMGFGDITAWVSDVSDISKLVADIEALGEVSRIETQSVIYTEYEVHGQESDSEGQLITYERSAGDGSVAGEGRYRFFTDDLSGYVSDDVIINAGETYVSPSMVSMFGIEIGDEVIANIARSGRDLVLTVKGFYEDPFMGSSMIGMKGFLISEADRNAAIDIINSTGIDALARNGAMLHIYKADDSITANELNTVINDNTQLAEYSEFVHSKEAIEGFMLVLQNAFSAMILAFALVLLVVVAVVISHSISSTVEADIVNIGILKTIGITSKTLRIVQLVQYMLAAATGMLFGLAVTPTLASIISGAVVTTTGVLGHSQMPVVLILCAFAVILLFLALFTLLRTLQISRVTPMQAIRSHTASVGRGTYKCRISAFGDMIHLRLAFRQLVMGRRRYIGALLVAVFLVFFASLAGRMNSWLGSDGKGMMDAFNPADHDLGVQVFGNLTAEEAENVVRSYTEIVDTYLLAMPSVAVGGVDYTANVITEPQRFHILQGRTCENDNEIVLTEFVADNFGVSIGDKVTVRGDSGSGDFVVSGIYSCANDMGDNVGMSRDGYLRIGRDYPSLWCYHYFLADASLKTAITEALEGEYGGDVHVHENTWPGLFGIISAMKALMVFMYVMVAVFILVVTVMVGSRILTAEQSDLCIYKVIGYKTPTLRMTFALRFGMAAVIGSVIGTAIATLMTDTVVSAVMKLAGISNFTSNPSLGGTLVPAAVVILLYTVFAFLNARRIQRTDIHNLICA